MKKLLVVDDEADVRETLAAIFETSGYAIDLAGDGQEAMERILVGGYDLYLFDLRLPGDVDGAGLLRKAKERHPSVPVVIVTGEVDVQTAVDAIKSGATNYLTKPMDARELLLVVDRALQDAELRTEVEDLKRINEQTVRLLTSISSVVISVDGHGKVVQWNATAEQTFDIKADEILGKFFRDNPVTWERERLQQAAEACRTRNETRSLDDVRFTRPDGKQGFLGLTINPVRDEEGLNMGFVILGKDITERKLIEHQLIQAQKLESIGQLAAGIAHEINTPTQFVGDNTRFLQDGFGDLQDVLTACVDLVESVRGGAPLDERIREMQALVEEKDLEYLVDQIPRAIEQSLEGLARVTKIVQAMREFSHPGVEDRSAVDINRSIESTLTVCRNEWKYVAEMVTDLDASLPLVSCYADELNQVILNLVVNASHAIADSVEDPEEDKGKITVSTRADGKFAEIRIADTGNGIPPSVQPRIFEPFFTTKATGKGTGQGLALALDVIVNKHGGTIHFETESRMGTTFVIRLPVSPPDTEA